MKRRAFNILASLTEIMLGIHAIMEQHFQWQVIFIGFLSMHRNTHLSVCILRITWCFSTTLNNGRHSGQDIFIMFSAAVRRVSPQKSMKRNPSKPFIIVLSQNLPSPARNQRGVEVFVKSTGRGEKRVMTSWLAKSRPSWSQRRRH